jgi:hypothetical protein
MVPQCIPGTIICDPREIHVLVAAMLKNYIIGEMSPLAPAGIRRARRLGYVAPGPDRTESVSQCIGDATVCAA